MPASQEPDDDNPLITTQTVNVADLKANQNTRSFRFHRDKKNNIWAVPVISFIPGGGTNFSQTDKTVIGDGTTPTTLASVASIQADGLSGSTYNLLLTSAWQMGFNGASWDRVRVANVFKTVAATALGNTAVWTPASGKKFRLMGGLITIAGTAAAISVEVVQLTDGAAGTVIVDAAGVVPTALASGQTVVIPFTLGQGYLSGAANTVLEANLGTAMASGAVYVSIHGTEE